MNDNDTSDQAYWEFRRGLLVPEDLRPIAIWKEAVRRCEALIEIKDKALCLAHQLHQEEVEERERKAFEMGCITGAKMVYCDNFVHRKEVQDSDWRTFKEANP